MSGLLGPEGGPAPGTEGVRFGFFTDSSICIGCKACEVACKEWNDVPDNPLGFTANSYDNTGALGANAWRHVAFVEQGSTTADTGSASGDFRWLMSSDVCKHCSSPACLEVCPTGALFTTEFATIVVQDDVCNGCGYCVTACPFGVIERREADGGAWKCTMCYDRMRGAKEPACAQACPTDSIQFGPLEELRAQAAERLAEVVASGETRAQLYGEDPDDGVGGTGALFLLLDDPEVYRLPPDPVTPSRHLARMWAMAGAAAGALAAVLAGSLVGERRR
ncbi:MAG: 4Fe-4S dicluster domain-containing protein [Actinobacteria bacterium]|nr:4Fe-4S dicluster domain-containing protein [Actinomycetota bacterium]